MPPSLFLILANHLSQLIVAQTAHMIARLSNSDLVPPNELTSQLRLPVAETRAKIIINTFVRNNLAILGPQIRESLPGFVLGLKEDHVFSAVSDAI